MRSHIAVNDLEARYAGLHVPESRQLRPHCHCNIATIRRVTGSAVAMADRQAEKIAVHPPWRQSLLRCQTRPADLSFARNLAPIASSARHAVR
jgi:hypothetical protein